MRIWASLRLLSTDEGGRTTPFVSGYRPQFFTADPDTSTSAFINVVGDGLELAPGEHCRICFDLLRPELFQDELAPGLKFNLREGPRIVGHGIVDAIDA
jgi:elongation factor Tu